MDKDGRRKKSKEGREGGGGLKGQYNLAQRTKKEKEKEKKEKEVRM
jgi:hypothetical protein